MREAGTAGWAGLVLNPRSRHNRRAGAGRTPPPGVLCAAPADRAALDEALARFAAAGVQLLIVDGGDGTVREVLTCAPAHFPAGLPRMAVLPSGKTNALALDLGAPRGWTLEAALAAARRGRVVERSPLEVLRAGAAEPLARGFLFGAGAFVRATELAQRTHRLGAFDEIAVGLTLGAAVSHTLFGRADDSWRSGEAMRLGFDHQPPQERQLFLLLASTLQRLPLGVRPFGPPADGLKALAVAAPPRRLLRALPILLSGGEAPWLAASGYERRRALSFDLSLGSGFVLDGETYPGGDLTVRQGSPVAFVTP